MSAAPAAAADAAPPASGGKKKLIIIIAAVLLVVLIGGGAAFFLLKKKPAEGEEGDDGHAKAEAHEPAPKPKPKRDPSFKPVFVPLDPFTVNLADKESERYAQVGVTLEIDDIKTEADLKLYMPAIRNNILLALADKTAEQLMERDGKTKLADQVRRETARAMGYEVEDPEEEDADTEAKPTTKKKKKKKVEQVLPVTAVHFSNFIIQ